MCAKAQAPKTRAKNAQVEQRHAGVLKCEIPCDHAEGVVDFASGRGYPSAENLPKRGYPKFFGKNFLANKFHM